MRRLARLLAAVPILLVGCSAAPTVDGPAADESTAEPSPTPTEDDVATIRLAAVGDSITAADSPDLAGGVPGPQSWVSYAVGDGVELVGGWAVWGASTAEMAQATEPMDADVLVILGGTNDVFSLTHEQIEVNIVAITEAAQVPAVVLSAIPPIDNAPAEAAALNEALEDLAAEQGWTWVDSSTGLRDGDQFATGMTDDGVHPTQAGAQIIGEAIGEAVRRAADQ